MAKIISYPQLFDLLPQRAPFLMLDRLECVAEGEWRALKNVTINENFFVGHFPGNPIMPGVLQLETMTQAAAAAWKLEQGFSCVTRLKSLQKMRFKNPVLPGTKLLIDFALEEICSKSVSVRATAKGEDGKVFSQAQFTLVRFGVESLDAKSLLCQGSEEYRAMRESGAIMNSQDISEIIPHRYPFHFIDNVLHSEEMRIVGEKYVTINEYFMQGNVPGSPFLPASVIAETAAQLGCVQMLKNPENADKLGLFMAIDDAEFSGVAVPGDSLIFDFKLQYIKSRMGRGEAKVYRGEEEIASMNLAFAIVPK